MTLPTHVESREPAPVDVSKLAAEWVRDPLRCVTDLRELNTEIRELIGETLAEHVEVPADHTIWHKTKLHRYAYEHAQNRIPKLLNLELNIVEKFLMLDYAAHRHIGSLDAYFAPTVSRDFEPLLDDLEAHVRTEILLSKSSSERLVTPQDVATFLRIERTSLKTKSWPDPKEPSRGRRPGYYAWEELRPKLEAQYPMMDWDSF